MSRIIRNCQNKQKAIELKLQQVSQQNYQVILAGMSLSLRPGCLNGLCENDMQENYLYLENETYKLQAFNSIDEADRVYMDFKGMYID